MPGIFSQTLQPAIVSLCSSTSSRPLALASQVLSSTDLVQDSFISILDDSTDSNEQLIAWQGSDLRNSSPDTHANSDNNDNRNIRFKGKDLNTTQNIRSRVLHIQAPNVKSTAIKFGSSSGSLDKSLAIKLPWLHLSVKDVGQLFYFEVTVLDDRGARVCFRVSTFQTQAKVHSPVNKSMPTLVHLPLKFPSDSAHRLTPWSTISLDLPTLLHNVGNISLQQLENTSDGTGSTTPVVRFGRFASLLAVQVHANCRLRRIWCTADPGLPDDGMILRGWQTELGLFAATTD
ncbi:hypothetical protein ACM66B_003898 [Microbotryomycetes sp. NB124-2]